MRILQATDCYPHPWSVGVIFTCACSRTNLFGAVRTSS